MSFHYVVPAKNNRYEFFMSIFRPPITSSSCLPTLPSLMSDVLLYYVCI